MDGSLLGSSPLESSIVPYAELRYSPTLFYIPILHSNITGLTYSLYWSYELANGSWRARINKRWTLYYGMSLCPSIFRHYVPCVCHLYSVYRIVGFFEVLKIPWTPDSEILFWWVIPLYGSHELIPMLIITGTISISIRIFVIRDSLIAYFCPHIDNPALHLKHTYMWMFLVSMWAVYMLPYNLVF